MAHKIKHLVVDTTAFIRAANLQEIADNIYTVQEVIDEITNDRQRRKLVVLPYDIKIKDVFTENIHFVTDFSKKTGDYTSLSATDIKVMALTYQLEKEIVGTEHLKNEPTMRRTINVSGLSHFNNNDKQRNNESGTEQEQVQNVEILNKSEKSSFNSEEQNCIETVEHNEQSDGSDNELTNEIVQQIENINLDDSELDKCIVKVSDEDISTSEDETDSDDGEWITPSNLKEKKKEMEVGEFEDKNVEVACITSDFAMQNVLKQINLNVTSIDGRVIRQLRTFIFRCTTCFKTTSVMTKLFCPKCGHATLKKVSVSVDDDGNQHIHINGRKPLTARGKRFSLPTPKGGQHFQYPILTEDQHIHKRFATKLARNKTNALDPDYIAGYSPFVMKDVNSKSAVLGVRADKQDIKYWMKHYSKGKKK